MKKITFVVFILTSVINAQSILVNEPFDPRTDFTVEQLIEEVLFLTSAGNGDVIVEGFQGNTNTSPNQRSWGVFLNPGGDFPFGQGLILSSGFANTAEGPNNDSGASGSGWAGDADIQAVLDNQYGTTVPTNDATFWEFTFVPIGCEVSFNYVFASEEYEADFECADAVRDGFAFLLKGPGLPDDSGTPFGGTNIAAIPGSNNVPVSTATIHADTFLCGDEQLGVNYFPDLYVSNSGANNQNVVQYDGYTEILTARADVIPGQQYTIKLVVADRGDTVLDSAVFFQAGSFQTGVALPDDFITADGNAVCEGDVITLNPNLNTTGDFIWSVLNPDTGLFEVIPGATNPTLDVTQAGTYQVEVEITSGCVLVDDITVEFTGSPDFFAPSPLSECDSNNTGITQFNLTDKDDEITGGNPDLTVVYYEDLDDAENETNPITDLPYQNTTPNVQTIFARVDDNNSNCFEIFELDLTAVGVPPVSNPSNLESCSDNISATFDLTLVEADLFENLNPADYIVSYYFSFDDADDDVNAIDSPEDLIVFQNTGDPIPIFVRVADVNDTLGCARIVTFDITSLSPPTFIQPTPFVACDEDGDDTETFDLTEKDAEILQTNPTASLIWFESFADEINNEPIANPTDFENTSNPQTVVARITGLNGCTEVTTLVLEVEDLPNVAATFPPYQECDDDNDGFSSLFNLNSQIALISSDPLLSITFHLTETDAEGLANEINTAVNFTNTVPNQQTLFVRVTDDITGCFVVRPYELETISSPEVGVPASGTYDLFSCEGTGGISSFDLTQNDIEIINGQANVVLTYHLSLDDAANGNDPIINASDFENTVNPQTIFIRLEDTDTGCVNFLAPDVINSFNVSVDMQAPVITSCPLETIVVSDDNGEFVLPDYFANGEVQGADNCADPVNFVSQDPAPGTILSPGDYQIVITVEDDASNTQECAFVLTVQNVLGIDDAANEINELTIYPNPVKDALQISNLQNLTLEQITIYDITGKELLKRTGVNTSLDVSMLSPATYFILIKTTNGRIVRKLIKE
ncbi:hypothetical protein GCM10009117_06030 [Gangjinia marincola]|uniref:HYR domain-containing protein n=1 Tax=Gangjinia marincola TaxID=578463 RepID=A0ABP3XUZ8_9FLAO